MVAKFIKIGLQGGMRWADEWRVRRSSVNCRVSPPRFVILGEKIVNLNIPKGAKIYLGAPAKPLDEALVLRIAELAASFPTVLEAHLPQCWVENVMPNPAQILVLVLASDEGVRELTNAVGEGLSRLLPNGGHMDVWQLPINHDLIPAIRKAGCRILGPDGKPI